MIDLGVLRIRDLLTPNEIMVKGSSIYLRVGRVRDIDRVLVDDIEVPYWVSLGMVVFDESSVSTPMDRVEVVYSTYYGRGKTKAEFLLAKEHVLITGKLTLIQDIVRLLLSEPGSNVFRPAEGGGALQEVSRVFPNERLVKIKAITAVSTVEQQIMSTQMRQKGLAPEERLVSLDVANVQLLSEGVALEMLMSSRKGSALIGVSV